MQNHFDPNKSLLSLPIVISTFSATLLLSIAMSLIIAINSDLIWNYSFKGFNDFVTYFKVPIGILSLNIPLIALFGANHRSEQTKAQMILTKQQNIFANHYKHIEEFEKFCTKEFDRIHTEKDKKEAFIEKQRTKGTSSAVLNMYEESLKLPMHVNPAFRRKLYSKIYPKSQIGEFSASKEYLESIDEYIRSILNYSIVFTTTPDDNLASHLERIHFEALKFIEENYFIDSYGNSKETETIFGKKITFPYVAISDFLAIVLSKVLEIKYVLEFDITYQPSTLIKSVECFVENYKTLIPYNGVEELEKFENFVPFDLKEIIEASKGERVFCPHAD